MPTKLLQFNRSSQRHGTLSTKFTSKSLRPKTHAALLIVIERPRSRRENSPLENINMVLAANTASAFRSGTQITKAVQTPRKMAIPTNIKMTKPTGIQ